ncbi:MAG TPA: FkbM family methyltransferase [Usitatibacter sp.]|nr:FkbM family methyltransferase [Usitatibacter sp.]
MKNFLIRGAGLGWTLRSGLAIEIRDLADWIVYSDIFVDGEYDTAIDQCLATAPPHGPLQVLDLGANVGFFTMRFVDRMLRSDPQRPFQVTMVEGSPRVAAELKRRVSKNPAVGSRARIVHGLVGAATGAGEIRERAFHAMNSTQSAFGKRVSVPYVDVDAMMQGVEKIDLLKCDIEGSELQFIENYPRVLAKARWVVMEMHLDLCDIPRCRQLLLESGFTSRVVTRTFDNISVELFGRP